MSGGIGGAVAGWGAAVRIAVREARRHLWRSLLVMLLVALPVGGAVVIGAVSMNPQSTFHDVVDKHLGAADLRVLAVDGRVTREYFDPMPFESGTAGMVRRTKKSLPAPTEADLRRVLAEAGVDAELHLTPMTTDSGAYWPTAAIEVNGREHPAYFRITDPSDSLVAPLVDLVQGRLPAQPDEIAVSRAATEWGIGVGSTLRTTLRAEPFTVTGLVRDGMGAGADVALWALPFDGSEVHGEGWLVAAADGSSLAIGGDVVEALNRARFVAQSRTLSTSAFDEEYGWEGGLDDDAALLVLVVTMIVIEIALLAGPAFAVTARQQSRSVALMSINGATPKQARRVVLAAALVLGGAGSVAGAALGLGVARGLFVWFQRDSYVPEWSMAVPWVVVGAAIVVGLVSALVASVVPAWLASRQDPVAVMKGRRGGAPSSRDTRVSAVLGSLVLATGLALMVGCLKLGDSTGAILLVTVAVVITTIGMVVVAPAVVAWVARRAGRLPFVFRYASRDAVRHRSRTVPAVAAVAAVVAGVVTVGVVMASDPDGSRDGWFPERVSVAEREAPWDEEAAAAFEVTWGEIEETTLETVPQAGTYRVRTMFTPKGSAEWIPGVDHESWYMQGPELWVADSDADSRAALFEGGAGGNDVDVERARAAVESALQRGLVVNLVTDPVSDPSGPGEDWIVHEVTVNGDSRVLSRTPVEAVDVAVPDDSVAVGVTLVPQALAEGFGWTFATSAVDVSGLNEGDSDRLSSAIASGFDGFMVSDEDSWYGESSSFSYGGRLMLLTLAAAGGVLMVLGTLSATMLALHDAESDLAVLSAVGASPVSRRGIAAAYALLVSGVGVVLGIVVGMVPALAAVDDAMGLRRLVIPWELLALVAVVVPVSTALVMAAATRSRLPLPRRTV